MLAGGFEGPDCSRDVGGGRDAFPPGGELEFLPLSLVRYADGQQMLSITGTVVRTADL